jgi:ketosteroid isomerase-like protein
MSSKRMAAAEAFLDRFLVGDLPGALEHVHPEVVLDEAASLPFGGQFHGHSGYLEFVQAVMAAIEFEVLGRELLDAGERVVAMIETTMTPRGGGPAVRMPVVEIYSFTDGRISRFDVFYKDTKALTDAMTAAGTTGGVGS